MLVPAVSRISSPVRNSIIRHLAIALACLASAVAQVHAQGSIQKCVGADGKVTYQDGACDGNARTAATIQRDARLADPLAIQRAQEERDWVREAAATRIEQQRIDELHAAHARAEDREAQFRAADA